MPKIAQVYSDRFSNDYVYIGRSTLFFKGSIAGLFLELSNILIFMQEVNVKMVNVEPSIEIRTHDRPLEHKPPPITTRPASNLIKPLRA